MRDRPVSRATFERNIFIFLDAFNEGRVHTPSIADIARLRPLPNGRIDMLSVNESARLQINTMMQMHASATRTVIRKESTDNVEELRDWRDRH